MNGGFLYLGLIKGFIVENGKEIGSEYVKLYAAELSGRVFFSITECSGNTESYPVSRLKEDKRYVGKADKYYFKELP